MRRLRSCVAVLLLVPFVGSGASWLAALHLMTHGNHHVAMDATDGRIAIVLEHGIDEHDDDHAPFSTHSHTTDDDHVVVIASADDVSVTSARFAPNDGGPSATLGVVSTSPPLRLLTLRPIRSGVGPPVPSRSSILRI